MLGVYEAVLPANWSNAVLASSVQMWRYWRWCGMLRPFKLHGFVTGYNSST
jgi:hypothetical protein